MLNRGGPDVTRYIERFAYHALLAPLAALPWRLTGAAATIISGFLPMLGHDYERNGDIAVHKTARIEAGATIKGPAIIGKSCFIAGSAYLRGGVFLDEDCVIGPGAELKSTFMFKGSKLAHLNFVGDSILGENVNCEAGSIIANYRNELDDKRIKIAYRGRVIDTGVEKFGALLGDGVRLGANAVVAPGALILPGTIVPRLGLVDQQPPRAV
ncbi:MAG: LpxA family transferase [Hyphomicrobiales bacterium]